MATKRRKKTQRVQINVRMREDLRARIEKAAKARGVSLNTETLGRLEQSFEAEGDDPTLRVIMQTCENFARVIEQTASRRMWHDPATYDAVIGVMVKMLEYVGPKGRASLAELKKPEFVEVHEALLDHLLILGAGRGRRLSLADRDEEFNEAMLRATKSLIERSAEITRKRETEK